MIRRWLQNFETAAACLGAAAAAALGLRVMISAVAVAQAESPPPVPVEQKPALESLAEKLTNKAEKTEEPPPAEAPGTGGSPLRLTLSVVAGPERSEVFVNGGRLGLSPYLGDFTCKQGEPLRIEVVPASGPLIERQARCTGKNVFIRE